MPSAKKICRVDPVPRYIMPDASEPDYRAILEQLQDYQSSLIGSSYYYIRAGEGYHRFRTLKQKVRRTPSITMPLMSQDVNFTH